MDRLAIDAAEAAVDAGYPPGAAAILLVELEGEAVEVEAEFERLLGVINASGATSTRVASDADDRARIWKGRKCAFSAVGRISPDFIVQDGVVPRTRLGEALAANRTAGGDARLARRQRVSCRRRQPAPADPLRRPRGRRATNAPSGWPRTSCGSAFDSADRSQANTASASRSGRFSRRCTATTTCSSCSGCVTRSIRTNWPTAARCSRRLARRRLPLTAYIRSNGPA